MKETLFKVQLRFIGHFQGDKENELTNYVVSVSKRGAIKDVLASYQLKELKNLHSILISPVCGVNTIIKSKNFLV